MYLDVDWKVVGAERLKMYGSSEVCALQRVCSVMAPAAAACGIAKEQRFVITPFFSRDTQDPLLSLLQSI